MIQGLRILVPLVNLTKTVLGISAKMDHEQKRAILYVSPPSASSYNLAPLSADDPQYLILSYTFHDPLNNELKLTVVLNTEESVDNVNLGVADPEKLKAKKLVPSEVMLIDEEGNAFLFPHPIGILVLTSDNRGKEVEFNIGVNPNLLLGRMIMAKPLQEEKEA